MLKLILNKISKIEDYICKQKDLEASNSDKQDISTPASKNVIDEVDISSLPARNAYSYALTVLDTLFSKDELGASLMFKSPKSTKPALDEKRVKQLLTLMQKRYKPHEYDIKVLISKINQKCRDSSVIKVKKEQVFLNENSRKGDKPSEVAADFNDYLAG